MAAEERAVLGEVLDTPVDVHFRVGQLAPALAGVREQHADPAVDVDPGVLRCGTGAAGQLVQLGLALGEGEGELLEHHGALMEGELSQRRLSHGAGVVEHGPQIEPVGRDAGDDLSR